MKGIRNNQGLIVPLGVKENGVLEAIKHKYTECITAAKRKAANTE